MGEGRLLPLFPLPVVLFPGASLPLHIFEERYRLMVGNAARDHTEFGILLVQESKLATVGCTAIVEKVVKEYEDGRFDVATVGRRRYRTLSLDQTKPYLQAWVEYIDDDPDPIDGKKLDRVVSLARAIAEALQSPVPDVSTSEKPSFVITDTLPLDLALKQKLLSQRTENERLDTLTEHLTELSERIDRMRKVQQISRTNGLAGSH